MRESVEIAADAQAVWPLVADPLRHGEWNPKVIAVDRQAEGAVVLHEQFAMCYQMSGRENHSQVEVIACDPPRRVAFRHRATWNAREQVVHESYEIVDIAHGVRLTQTIDMSRALPCWARALIWFIRRFGTSQGKPQLHRLRELAESTLSGSC